MQALVDLLSSSLAQRIGWALIHFLWQGTLVALLLAAVMQFLRHRSPQVRWFLACTAFGLMAVLPVVTAYTVSVDIPNVAEIEPLTEATTLPDSTPLVAAETELPFVAVGDPASPEVPSELPGDGAGLASTTPWLQQAKNFLHPILPWGVLVWLLGVVGISLWHFGGWLLLEKTKRLGTRPVAPAIRNILDQLLQRLRISRPIRLLESARVAVPVVVGWLRPVVLLPASLLSGLTPSQLEAILAHELAHIRRFDCLVKLIQAVIETFLFYHPAVWWISAHIRQESEHCCDELAVEICPDRKSYAHALARIAELTSRKPRLAAAASGGKLLSRIRRIVGLAEDHAGSGVRWLAGILVMVSLIVAGLIIYGNSAIGQTEIQPTTQPTAGVKELSWSKPFVINVQPGVKEPRWSKPFPTNVQSDMAVATAYEYWNKGEYELAIRDFDKAIKLDPSNASAYNDRGLVYLIKDDYDAAIRNFSQAIELNPRNAEPYHNRAVAYCAKEMYDHAIRYFDMAIALNPRNAEAYNSRGFAYMRRGNRDQAIRDFKRAVSLNPKYAPAQKNLSLAEQHKAQIPWGAPVEGVQVCLRADQNQWEVGQIPGFRVDMRNGAERHLELVLSEDHWEIELDGTWFRASVIRLYDPEKRRLGPGAIQEDIPFAPVEWAQWRSRPGNKPIEFTAGKHVIRLAFTANPSGEDEGLSVRAVSNPVEIEIQPATQPTKLELEKTAIEQGSQHIYEVYGTVYDCVLDSLWEDWLAGLETAESEEEFRRAFLEIENMQRPDHHPAAGVVVTLRGGSFTKETVTDGEGKFKFSGLP
ncbi:MAG: tetratricopeptide repeat protein, partial [Phycisphaerae bacterium]|nr:tetratricopeptide repeat protein [Phycisphaerae bacterium]